MRTLLVLVGLIGLSGAVLSMDFSIKGSSSEDMTAAYVTIPDFFSAAYAETSADADSQKMCLNGQLFSGCCSGRGGIKEFDGAKVLCRNGETSPTCSLHLQGCCSDHDGVKEVKSDGTVMCESGNESPSCSCGSSS
ncbi:MAG: hypothetical protein AAGC77_13565 [Pseudomonadota bacterium]